MCSPHRSQFVEDLVYLILESSEHWWPADLARLAQVSSAWLGPVRRRLFAEPRLHSLHACTNLARTLSDNPSLLPLIKGVDIQPIPRDSGLVSREHRASLNTILSIEGLQCLTLGGLLSVRAERFLQRVADASCVFDLHIDGSSMPSSLSPIDCPSLEWDESIAFQFFNLKRLRLTNIDLAISFPSIPYQLPLSELRFDHVTITRGYITHLLHETTSLPRLRIHSTRTCELDEQIRCVLDTCKVEDLDIEVDVEAPFQQSIFDVSSPSLRKLNLGSVQVDLDILHSISEHYHNLEDLTISGRTTTILPSEWASFIANGKLPHLRTLGLPWGTNLRPFARWDASTGEELLRAAAVYGIHVSEIGC
ncbi:hypothetical protein H0H92_011778 [Tricholoma furcatifolium]|nr:hypothetical protein H0H92_011778 [Tricholoma furcatifolium]